MRTVGDLWETSIHMLNDPETGKPTPVFVWAEPYLRTGAGGSIRVRAKSPYHPADLELITDFKGRSNYLPNTIALSNGGLSVSEHWRQRGLGRIALGRMVRWAQHYHPDCNVASYNIGNKSPEEIAYLKPLYESFGFFWNPDNPMRVSKEYYSNVMPVSRLKVDIAPRDPSPVFEIIEYMREQQNSFLTAKNRVSTLTREANEVEEEGLVQRLKRVAAYVRRPKAEK